MQMRNVGSFKYNKKSYYSLYAMAEITPILLFTAKLSPHVDIKQWSNLISKHPLNKGFSKYFPYLDMIF